MAGQTRIELVISPPKADTFALLILLVLPFSSSFKIRSILLCIIAYLFSACPALLLPFSAVMGSKIYKRRTPEKFILYTIVSLHFQEVEFPEFLAYNSYTMLKGFSYVVSTCFPEEMSQLIPPYLCPSSASMGRE